MSKDRENANPSARASATPRPAKTPAERIMPPVVYRLPGMDDVTVHANQKYTGVDNPFLLMDVYTPPGLSAGDLRPIVMLVHGAAGAQFKLGYAKPLLAEAALDVSNALSYIRTNADSFNADPGRIGLVTWSGGGPLLSTAMREKPLFVRCLVALYAYLDIQRSPFHIENETPECLKAFSPISYLQGDTSAMIPLFVARAGQDEVPMMNDSIDRFLTAATEANAPLTYMNHPFGEHGFDNQNDDDRSREIIRAALAFLRTHLGSGMDV